MINIHAYSHSLEQQELTSNIVETVNSLLSEIAVESLVQKKTIRKLNRVQKHRADSAISKMKYSEYGNTIIKIPPHFKGNLLKYAETLYSNATKLITNHDTAVQLTKHTIGELFKNRSVPDHMLSAINEPVTDSVPVTKSYFVGDKDVATVKQVLGPHSDLVKLVNVVREGCPITDNKWLSKADADTELITKQLRAITDSVHGTSDMAYKKQLKHAGTIALRLAEHNERVALCAWECDVLERVVIDLQLQITKDIL